MELLTPSNVLAWALQAAAVVLVAAPLPRLAAMWSPSVRMAYWRVVLIGCLLLPGLQPWTVRDESPQSPAPSVASVEVRDDRSPATTADRSSPSRGAARFDARWLAVYTIQVLAAGIILRLAWLGLGVLTVGRVRRSSRPLWPRPPSVDRAATLAETDAEFLVSPVSSRPVTCGWFWPVVLVPRTFESFPEEEQTAIATHELLHVSRADWARNAIDEVIRACFWFHPGIWYVINQIQLAREQVVDREAVRRLGARQPYLEALLRLARPAPRLVVTPAALFLKRAHLRQRVTLIVKEASMSRARLLGSLAVMALVIVVAGRLAVSAFPLQQSGAKPGQETAQQNPVVGAPRPGIPTESGPVPQKVTSEQAERGAGRSVPGGVAVRAGSADAFARSVVHKADPSAPGATGSAAVALTVEADGSVRSATPIELPGSPRDPAADAAAVSAARAWRFGGGRGVTKSIVAFNLTPENTSGQTDNPPAVRIGGNVPQPLKTRDVKPIYPEAARVSGLQGAQILEASIAPTGEILDVRVVQGQEGLAEAAAAAVLQWRFLPWDRPERRIMTVTVNFMLDPNAAARPASWHAGALRVGGSVQPPTKTRDVRPAYPPEALDQKVQGVVIFEILVGGDGKVADTRVLRSVPMLDEAAEAAVRQWEFTPTLVDGTPVPVIMTVTVNFALR